MSALHHKLYRDVWTLRGQAVAIALVIGAGLSAVIMSLITLDSLVATRDQFYTRHDFAQVFAPLKRAPEAVAGRIAEIPGVGIVETRVTAGAIITIEDFAEPVSGYILSMPKGLNRLYLRAGGLPTPGRGDEIVLGEAFANAHGLKPGDQLSMVMNGRRVSPRIVGIALSPEFVYQIGPGELFPDFARNAIVWMDREAMAVANDLDGAFNNVVMTLSPLASEKAVIQALDNLLDRWGGFGAYERKDQQSHYFLSEDIKQLRFIGNLFSVIFLSVSAFLLHIVVSRLVDTQREQIAALKAFGYSNLRVGLHYSQMVLLIVLMGTLLGIAIGVWLGYRLANFYMLFYLLPDLNFQLQPEFTSGAVLITLLAAVAGTTQAVRKAVRLPPAQAMQPEPPAIYRPTIFERLGFQHLLSPAAKMVLRQLERRPWRSAFSSIGIGFAAGILVMGTFFPDAMDYIVDLEFHQAQREDLAVAFVEPSGRNTLHELQSLPGVQRVEPFRAVAVRLKHRNLERRTAIQGYTPKAYLHRVLDKNEQPADLPDSGLLMSDGLAELMQIQAGDSLQMELLEGRRSVHQVKVAGIIKQFIGSGVYMDMDALNRLLRDGDVLTGAVMSVEQAYRNAVQKKLEDRPRVAGTRARDATIRAWRETVREMTTTYVSFIALLAGAITIGVVYNSARITLSERSRELASLRVLGFTRGEISRILMGELAILVLLAIPLGFLIGHLLAWQMASTMPKELFQVPVVILPQTYSMASAIVLTASLLSAFLVRRRLDRLDIITALKTKE